MKNYLEYKGYRTRIEFDPAAKLLHGKIEGISDLVTFENEFHTAVDDYLDFCKEIGKCPEKEYRGLFNVRIKPELHKKLAYEAFKSNVSINAIVESALNSYINGV